MGESSAAETMPQIPEMSDVQVAFGSVDHLPAYDTLPDDYQRQHAAGCRAVSTWFFAGPKMREEFDVVPREGVDERKALRAIGAALGSWAPKHEHKIAGCGWLLDQWFVVTPKAA